MTNADTLLQMNCDDCGCFCCCISRSVSVVKPRCSSPRYAGVQTLFLSLHRHQIIFFVIILYSISRICSHFRRASSSSSSCIIIIIIIIFLRNKWGTTDGALRWRSSSRPRSIISRSYHDDNDDHNDDIENEWFA